MLKSSPSKSVLVVDDAKEIRQAVRAILEMEGHTVWEAVNGQEALQMLQSGQRPDLILLDLMMPVMDGRTFLAELYDNPANQAFSTLPIVIITAARENPNDWTMGFLAKPFGADNLLDTVVRYAR